MTTTEQTYSLFCDLKQVEVKASINPTDLIRRIFSIGTIEDLEIDLGQQEILDGEVIDHPVISCRFMSSLPLTEINQVLSSEYFVIDEVEAFENIADQQDCVFSSKPQTHYLLNEIHLQLKKSKQNQDDQKHLNYLHNELSKMIKKEEQVPLLVLFESVEDKLYQFTDENDMQVDFEAIGGDIILDKEIFEQLREDFIDFLLEFKKQSVNSGNFSIDADISQDNIILTVQLPTGMNLEKIHFQKYFYNTHLFQISADHSSNTFKVETKSSLICIPCGIGTVKHKLVAAPLTHSVRHYVISQADLKERTTQEDGNTFLQREDDQVPIFYIEKLLGEEKQNNNMLLIHELDFGTSTAAIAMPVDFCQELVIPDQYQNQDESGFKIAGWSSYDTKNNNVFMIDILTLVQSLTTARNAA